MQTLSVRTFYENRLRELKLLQPIPKPLSKAEQAIPRFIEAYEKAMREYELGLQRAAIQAFDETAEFVGRSHRSVNADLLIASLRRAGIRYANGKVHVSGSL